MSSRTSKATKKEDPVSKKRGDGALEMGFSQKNACLILLIDHAWYKLGVMVYNCCPNTEVVGGDRWIRIQSFSWIHNEFKACLGDRKPCFKINGATEIAQQVSMLARYVQ